MLAGFGGEGPVITALLEDLSPRIPDAANFAWRHRVLLLRTADGIAVDVALGAMPFEEAAIARATDAELARGAVLRTCSATDLVVHKAFAARPQDWVDIEPVGGRASDVSGLWTLEWTVGSDSAPSAVPDSVARLSLALLPADGPMQRMTVVQGYSITHFGVFGGDANALAPGLRDRDAPPPVGARAAGDSLSIVLNPDLDHGSLVLDGRIDSQGASRRWYHTADGGNVGTFSLRRPR